MEKLVSGTWTVSAQQQFQIPFSDVQESVKLQTYNYLGNNFEVLAFSDSGGTRVVEFDGNGNVVATVFDRTQAVLDQLVTYDDGRVGLVYNEFADALASSQLVTHVYDLRAAGLVSGYTGVAVGTTGHDFAGTQFVDTVQGVNSAQNTYYYVGATTSGAAPTDQFAGGTGSGSWNTIVFADERDHYAVSGTSTVTVTNVDPSHEHAGAVVATNTQVLAFNPDVDTTPLSDGSLDASGNTLMLFGPFSGNVTIESGATFELAQPSGFTGHVDGFSPQNFIDLDGFDPLTVHTAFSGSSSGGTLTVTDATHTIGNGAAGILLNGSYVSAGFTSSTDGHGGVDIGMVNLDEAFSDNIVASAALLPANGSINLTEAWLLQDDTDADQSLSVTSVSPANTPQTTLGQVQIVNGQIVYTAPGGYTPPAQGQSASDGFNYTITDSPANAQSTAHVGLTVIGGNQLTGTQGNDVMIGTTGNTLTGFAGNDTFVFNQNSGAQTISDFTQGQDHIELDAIFSAANDPAFVAFLNNLHAAADSVHVLDLGGGNTVTTAGVSVNQLHANDFIVH
jgi:hypothetical protein